MRKNPQHWSGPTHLIQRESILQEFSFGQAKQITVELHHYGLNAPHSLMCLNT